MPSLAHLTIEQIARDCYGRLLAYLSAGSCDLAAAEDALAEAFAKALQLWPRDGVPSNPEAWILTVARRKRIDATRKSSNQSKALRSMGDELERAVRQLGNRSGDETDGVFQDERLKLMFVCAHPAIDEVVRTPLILQCVLGLDAARIASAMLVAPTTMGQRLSRAKRKIRDAQVPFQIPDSGSLPLRLDAVLEAIYAAFGIGWEDSSVIVQNGVALVDEAIWLARLANESLPDEPEILGLLSLMLFCDARKGARRDDADQYIPFNDQRVENWDRSRIEEAEFLLRQASNLHQIGHFQLEAAIQSAHTHRRLTGIANWPIIVQLFEGLLCLSPTLGVRVGHAAAVCEAVSARAALEILDRIDPEEIKNYLPYWALRADCLAKAATPLEAADAYHRAIGLCEDQACRKFLLSRVSKLNI